ncbi:MAG: hypothetical protein IJ026_00330 [Candidatus Methanomethylophilaceae archaeon]|nr:hypothetical protein [Candidatus Methanomethylophilaceae archaeon]
MTDGIKSLEDVRNFFDGAGVRAFEVSDAFGEGEGPVIVGDNTLEDVRDLAEAVGAKVVFVEYDYIEPEDLVVNPEDFDLEEIFGDDAEEAERTILEHNDTIIAQDWDEPYAMTVFIMHEGHPFGMQVISEEFDEFLVSCPAEYVSEIYEEMD